MSTITTTIIFATMTDCSCAGGLLLGGRGSGTLASVPRDEGGWLGRARRCIAAEQVKSRAETDIKSRAETDIKRRADTDIIAPGLGVLFVCASVWVGA